LLCLPFNKDHKVSRRQRISTPRFGEQLKYTTTRKQTLASQFHGTSQKYETSSRDYCVIPAALSLVTTGNDLVIIPRKVPFTERIDRITALAVVAPRSSSTSDATVAQRPRFGIICRLC